MTTFLEAKQRAAYLASIGGSQNTVTGADWGALINSAYQNWWWDTESLQTSEQTFTTVINQAEYVLPTPYFHTIKDVAYGTTTRLIRTSEEQEQQRDPLWFVRTAVSTPSRWLNVGWNVIRLVDTPSVAGDTVTVRGTRMTSDLSADSDEFLIPDVWHEQVICYAAWLHCRAFAAGEADTPRVASYLADYNEAVKEAREVRSNAMYGTARRVVQRGYRGRVPLQGYGGAQK